jgi:hypothetical protein
MKSKTKTVVGLVVILSLGLVIAACGGSRPEPGVTVEDLVNVWKQDKGIHLQFNEDGTHRFATAVHWLETAPFEVGQYQLEGTSLTFIASNESFDCTGLRGSYEVELTEEGQLQFVLQEDACEMRGVVLPARPWDRVEP